MDESGQKVEYVQQLEPIVSEQKLWNQRNLFLAFGIGVAIVIMAFIIIFSVEMTLTSRVFLWAVLVIIYAAILYFLLEPGILRQVQNTEVRTIERTVEKPVVREVTRYIEKPVVREVVREAPKTIFIETQRQKLNIPKYSFLGSSETRTYHKKSCRLGKLIKKKYKIQENDPIYFKKRGFKPCKVCLVRGI